MDVLFGTSGETNADRWRITPFGLVGAAIIAAGEPIYVSKPILALFWYRRGDGMAMD
jgi:hypothetical protein